MTFTTLLVTAFLYLLIAKLVKEIFPALDFYVSIVFILYFTLQLFDFARLTIGPMINMLPPNLTVLMKGMVMTALALFAIELLDRVLISQQESALSFLIEMSIKIALIGYWFQLLQG